MSDTDKPEPVQDEAVRAFRNQLDRMEARQRLPVVPVKITWRARRNAGLKNIAWGFTVFVIGIVVTYFSYKWSESSGDRYYTIVGGAIVLGAALFFWGIFQIARAYFQHLLARKS